MGYWEFTDLPDDDRKALLDKGKGRLDWAISHMPVLKQIASEIDERGHLANRKISMALHTEAKTGILALTLARCGAHVRLASCNPLSTDDPVALALQYQDVSPGTLEVQARYGETTQRYYEALNWSLDQGPDIVIDDGGDLVKLLHTDRKDLLPNVLGGCEETTTGIIRLKALQEEGKLLFPMMDVNNCDMKHLFDNRYGTGQSTMDGILNATNLTIAGMRVAVAGYGWCGRGIAMRLKGLGANVTVSEIDPIKGVEAAMDGFRVLPLEKIAHETQMIVTATGCKDVVFPEVIDRLSDGCLLANSGHFDNEIDVEYLNSFKTFKAREHVTGHNVNGKTIYLLSEGRLVNLASGQGHPVEIMDMSFAIQAAGAEFIALNHSDLPNEVISFPKELDQRIASLKLENMGYSITSLTDDQKRYLSSWEDGT